MKLLLKLGVDDCCGNLSTKYEVAIIILDEYKQGEFRDIVLAYQNSKNNHNQYHTIDSNLAAYILLHYILFFPYRDLGWDLG